MNQESEADFLERWTSLLSYFAFWSTEDQDEGMRKYYRDTFSVELIRFVEAYNRFKAAENT